jgi:sporulation related protein
MISLFSTEGSESGGGRQRVLLLLLLLIIAGFCYLYFFTNMIVSHEKPAPPPSPSAPVKQPIPPRPDQVAPPKEAAAPAKPSDQPPEKTPAATGSAQVAAPASQDKPAAAPAKPAAAPAKPAAAPAKPAAAPAKPAAAPAKPAAAVQNTKGTPAVKASANKKGAPPVKEAVKQGAKGSFVLFFGEYPKDESLKKVKEQLKREGIKPVQEVPVKTVRKMNRLFVAEFDDRANAESERAKLAKITTDAFILREEGSFRLYAGSYLVEKRALSEKNRLSLKGIAVSVNKIDLPVTTIRVAAGKFATKSEAEAAAKKIRKAGLSAKVVDTRKK